jgi:hypothetical protein
MARVRVRDVPLRLLGWLMMGIEHVIFLEAGSIGLILRILNDVGDDVGFASTRPQGETSGWPHHVLERRGTRNCLMTTIRSRHCVEAPGPTRTHVPAHDESDGYGNPHVHHLLPTS